MKLRPLLRPDWTAALVAVLLCACTSYSPSGLAPGSSVAAVVKDMGQPTGESPLPDGGRRLEFARGPYGKHTYMLDFDTQGSLVSWQQVLTEARFNGIHAGMDAKEVLAQIGHPAEYINIGWQHQVAWSYRFDSPMCLWFQVGMGLDSKVVDTAYGQDPICDRKDSKWTW